MALPFIQNAVENEYFSVLTQKLANYLPEYFFGRYDKHSITQGFMNPIMKHIENIASTSMGGLGFDNIIKRLNYMLPEIGEVYLGNTYEFQTYIDAKGNDRFVPPTVIANPSTDNIQLSILPENDMVSLAESMPTRADFIYSEVVAGLIFTGQVTKNQTLINKHLIGTVTGLTNPDGFIFIEVVDEPSVDYLNIAVPRIIISGRDYAGNTIRDEIRFYKSGVYKTDIKFSYITGVKGVHILQPLNINIYDYPANSKLYDYFDSESFIYDESRDEQTLMYKTSQTWAAMLTYAAVPKDDMISLITTNNLGDIVSKYELKDIAGNNVSDILSIVPVVGNRFYAATQSHIYIYDRRDIINPLFKDYKGHESTVEIAPILDAKNNSRDLYSSGTGTSTSSNTLLDAVATYQDNELVGKCLIINNYEYVILQNTQTAITVSQLPSTFTDLTVTVPAPSPYSIVEYNTSLDVVRVIEGEKPRRLHITVESEYGYTYYIGENGFTESRDVWNNNHPTSSDDDIVFNGITIPFPFDGGYLVTFEFETYNGKDVGRQKFDVIYTVPSKRALAELDITSLGKNIIGTYFDNGFLRVVFDDDTSNLLKELKDYFVVDTTNKRVIVFEQYDEITPTNTKPIYKNIVTPLDNFGMSFGIDRIDEEDLYSYTNRIIDRYKNRPGNTYKGVVNSIGRNLGFITSTPLEIDILSLFTPIVIDGVNVYAVDDVLYDTTASYNVDEFVGMTLSIGGILFEIIENGVQFIVVGNPSLQSIIDLQSPKTYTILPVKSPFIKVTPTRITLYSNYLSDYDNVIDLEVELSMEKTVYDVYQEINSLSAIFSSVLVPLKNGDHKTMVARTLMPQNNIEIVTANGSASTVVNLGVSNIVPGSVKSFSQQLINEKPAIKDVITDGDYFVDVFAGTVTTYKPVNQNVEVSAVYTAIPFRLYASPIILSDIRDSEYIRTLFEQREKEVYENVANKYINGSPLDQFFLDYELIARHNNIHWGK